MQKLLMLKMKMAILNFLQGSSSKRIWAEAEEAQKRGAVLSLKVKATNKGSLIIE